MPERTPFQKLVIAVIVVIGVFPLAYFFSVKTGIAHAEPGDNAQEVPVAASFDRFVENVAFGVGEKLTYNIKYGFIQAGTGSMEVARLVEYQNRPCYQVVTRAQSSSFFSTFFKVDDRVESIIDAVGLFSWRFEKKLQEGSYSSYREYGFDQRNNSVVYKGDTMEVAPFVQDALSVLYYVRTQPLVVGDSFTVNAFIDGRKLEFEVKVHRRETVKVEAGTFDCFVVEPLSQSVGIFKHQGRIQVWLTDDRVRLPVLMKTKVLVGSINAELTDFELGDIDAF
jgi:hypothetical protein